VKREHHRLWSPGFEAEGGLLAYGHWGRPVLAFPTSEGSSREYEDFGMVAAISDLIEGGRAKLYVVDSADSASWFARHLDLEDRALVHDRYEQWIVDQVLPFIVNDCGGRADVIVTGCSFGAYHAANVALRRADIFPLAICHSGMYDIATLGDGHRGDAVYFHNPVDYVAQLDGEHLDWLRRTAHLVLVCGQGQWEDTTGSLDSTRRLAEQCHDKGLNVELDLWGHDVPHDWPSWCSQLAHHLPRFC